MIDVMPQKPRFKLKEIQTGESTGQRIARFRKSAGLTQVEVAEKIGITQGLYSAYERGRLRLSAEMAAQIALALGAPVDEVLGLKKQPAPKTVDGKLLRRLEKIEALPPHKKKILISNIDMFLKGALGGRSGEATNKERQSRAI